jgi:hypothetical protein
MATAATPEATTPDPYTLVPERPRYARAPTHREFVHVGAERVQESLAQEKVLLRNVSVGFGAVFGTAALAIKGSGLKGPTRSARLPRGHDRRGGGRDRAPVRGRVHASLIRRRGGAVAILSCVNHRQQSERDCQLTSTRNHK